MPRPSKCHRDRPNKAHGLCGACYNVRYRATNKPPSTTKEYIRNRDIRLSYGITTDDYAEQSSKQKGACSICGCLCPTGRRLSIDHDHVRDFNRDLLCMECNTGLGKFKDSPALLRLAASYIERHLTTINPTLNKDKSVLPSQVVST